MISDSGVIIRVGDSVRFSGGMTGVVVVCLDDKTALSDYCLDDWLYLEDGLLIDSLQGGLVHVSTNSGDIEIINPA
ncbi:hypothetical protein [Chitinilyticum aquatile]|uniref:hypothetical protein n=1 Tax=Chitinilyticum aquatile TaxID=362520 RepID=UPI0012DD5E0A|nr:hypothetical protein [Chitinilyticum aquatile]